MDDFDLSQFTSSGPIQACYQFLETVLADVPSYDNGWHLMDKNLRLCRAQAWLWNNREFKNIADRLEDLASHFIAGPHSGELLWEQFSAIELRMVRDAWHADYKRKFGAASQPRLIGPDLELIMLVPTDGEVLLFDSPTLLANVTAFIMRLESDGWRVAAWGDRLPEPGWPPHL